MLRYHLRLRVSRLLTSMERWLSGWKHRSWKPAMWKHPWVRIPLSPPNGTSAEEIRHLRKYPSGRRGSPAKGVGCVKSAAEVQILSSAPSKNLEAITVSRFFLFLVKTFLLRFGIVPSVGYIVGDIVVYFTDFVLQLTLLFIILSWAEDSSSSHEIDSVEYR